MTQTNPDKNIEDVTCAVLCGGRGKRMGADKPFVPFMGRPIISHTLETVSRIFSKVVLSARNPDQFSSFELPVIKDSLPIFSPLSGIHAVLSAINTKRACFVAVDMPLVQARLLRLLATIAPGADIVVPKIDTYFEPLLAVYSTRCAGNIKAHVENGDRRVVSFFEDEDLTLRILTETEFLGADPDRLSLLNLNTMNELKDLEKERMLKIKGV